MSARNCKNEYPYAMAFKRLFDRVVLKQCKLAYDGIYSDSEADEFKDPMEELPHMKKVKRGGATLEQLDIILEKAEACGANIPRMLENYNVSAMVELTPQQAEDAIKILDVKIARRAGA